MQYNSTYPESGYPETGYPGPQLSGSAWPFR